VGDVEAVLRLMSEDVVFIGVGRPPMKGRAAFEQGLRAVFKSHRIESRGDVQEVQVSGDLGYCWTRLTVRVIALAGGEVKERTGDTLSIFRRQTDGSWVLIRDANLLP
jgi:uncharacterized protein (TIGR02246 family)